MCMTKKILLFSAALLSIGFPAAAETFTFAYTKGEKYRMLTTVTESVFMNGKLVNKAEILDKISAEVTDVKAGSGFTKATYETSTRDYGSLGSYEWSENYASEFWRDKRGLYDIADSYYMPIVRDVPTFPEGDVAVGGSWTAPGSESHDFRRNFGIEEVFRFPITVNYTYVRNETKNGVDCAVFEISYNVFYKVPVPFRAPEGYPARITASSRQVWWWDRANRRPYCAEESFDFVFSLTGGQEVEFIGEARGELLEAQPLDKGALKRDIQKQLEEKKIPDATVREDPQGVVITLENVQFAPNSGALLPSEKEKLGRIAEILKQYPDRDLLITGHTAATPAYTPEQHQELSEQRARAVGDYLISTGARKPQSLRIKGMGDTAPVADNATEAGKARNRRVEITILEN